MSADPTTQQPTSQSVDVDDHVPLGLLHSRNLMRFQPQLLSEKRFHEHLDPLPFGGLTIALKELDESGIQARLLRRQPVASEVAQPQLHFWDTNPLMRKDIKLLPCLE
jgi:hypothetical protein